MRRQPTIAVLLCITPVICVAQHSSHKLSEYAGTWQANFHGTRFMTIKLVDKNGHLTGSTSLGDIRADPNGKITRVEAATSEAPIVSSRLLRFGGLELRTRGDDPNDTITLTLKLIDAKNGFVRFGNTFTQQRHLSVPCAEPLAVPKPLSWSHSVLTQR
jgi:hypothetical protein